MVEIKLKKRNKYYFIEYRVDGKRYRRSLKVSDKRTAKILATDFQAKLLRSELRMPDENKTLEEAVEEYLSSESVKKSHNSATIDRYIFRLFSNFTKEGSYEIKSNQAERY